MDATELGGWTRFAAKGGIGKCTALQDCVAEQSEDLMFLKDDEITVLMQLPEDDVYLGYCEGVVGRFSASFVRFHGRLKRPVLAKRSSSVASSAARSPRPSSSQSAFTLVAREASPSVPPRGSPSLPLGSPLSGSPATPFAPSPHLQHSLFISAAHSPTSQSGSDSPVSVPSSPNPVRRVLEEEVDKRLANSYVASGASPAPAIPADNPGDAEDDTVKIVGGAVSPQAQRVESPEPMEDALPAAPALPPVAPLVFRSKSGDNHAVPSDVIEVSQPASVDMDTEENDYNVPIQLRSESAYSNAETPSDRVSFALSDSGINIGLSLLQDFVGGGGDEDDRSEYSNRRSPTPPAEHIQPPSYPESPMDAISGHASPPPGPLHLHSPSALSVSQYSASPTSDSVPLEPPRGAFMRGPVDSMLDPDFDPASWEGASDIFDDYYRLSRYSVMSRMSRMSKASGSDIPPIPRELASRPSMDSLRGQPLRPSPESFKGKGVESPGRPSEDSALERAGSPLKSVAPLTVRAKPSPLALSSDRTSYPLLHGSFGSPPPDTAGSFASTGTSLTSPTSQDEAREEDDVDLTITGKRDAPDLEEGEQRGPSIDPPATASSLPMELAPLESATQPLAQPSAMSSPPPVTQPPEQVLSPPSGQETPSPVVGTRPLNPNRPPPHPYARQSIFMPHPHAPKPAEQSLGPLYGRQQHAAPLPHESPHAGPPPGSVFHALHSVLQSPRPRQTTIYGWFEYDLAMSTGPVPVAFGTEPPNNIPANKPGASRSLRAPSLMQGVPAMQSPPGVRSPPPPSQTPLSAESRPSIEQRMASPGADPRRVQSPAIDAQRIASPVTEIQRTATPEQGAVGAQGEGATKAIPRANFFPQAGTARPRSRSFSGFDPPQVEIELPAHGSREDPKSPVRSSSMPMLTKRSKSAMATTTVSAPSVPSPQRATVSHAASVVRGVHAPSPLSLSQNNMVAEYKGAPPISSSRFSAQAPSSSKRSIKSPPPMSPPATPASLSHATSPSLSSQHSEPRSSMGSPLMNPHPKLPPVKATTVPVIRHSRSTISSSSKNHPMDVPPRSASSQGRRSEELQGDVVTPPAPAVPGLKPIDTGGSRHGSLRPSLSASMLRVQSLQQGERSPSASISSFEREQKTTVQVQDMDFELIEPVGPASPLGAQSVDSLPLSSPSPVVDHAQLSPEPLTPSVASMSIRGPSFDAPRMAIPAKPLAPAQVEAHRQRELRWMQVLSSVSAAQARKSKKVRKMVFEGVPASVRYRVWAYLTDSAAKRMDGLYPRLLKREHVRAYAQIEADVRILTTAEDIPATHGDSLKNILQAYLSMVPDVQYSRGLCSIAGQLLAQSPEEDAFWTFICLMDTHIRPYFSAYPVQLDIDATLFGKAVEANDSALAKKLFVDVAITPARICKPWFTSLFGEALSPEYVHRIWDVFLFEGVPFLFRVGIAILTCTRQLLLQCTSHDALFALLAQPPPNNLPPSPDAFVELALGVRLKDDDVRKQRAKMEASMKRQTQGRALSAQPGAISLPTR